MSEPIDWTPTVMVKKNDRLRQRLADALERAEQSDRLTRDLATRLSRIREKARAMTGAPTWEVHKAGEVIEQLALGYDVPQRLDLSGRGINDHLQEIGRGTREARHSARIVEWEAVHGGRGPVVNKEQLARQLGVIVKGGA